MPLDFRLGFGQFAGGARVVHLMEHPSLVATHVELAGSAAGDLSAVFRGIVAAGVDGRRTRRRGPSGSADLSADETARREKEEETLRSTADPIHPARIYGELRDRLEPDAVVIVDGGDFGSYAGKLIDTETPGSFLDPGPYGCLGTGPGLRPRRPAGGPGPGPARPAGVPHARRRGGRVLADGLRHARPPRGAGGGHRRQQRDLGPREAPDAGALRLRRGGRAPARAPATTRWWRPSAGTASW